MSESAPLIERWQALLRVFQAPDAESAEVRARHLAVVMRHTPAMMAANVANGLLFVAALHGRVPWIESLAWLALLTAYCGAHVRLWWRWQQRQPKTCSPRTIGRAAMGAMLLAALWAYTAVCWLPLADMHQRLLVSTVMVGMMCGGAFVLSNVPQAALGFITVMVLGSVVGLHRLGPLLHLEGLLLIYAVVLGWGALASAQSFNARLLAQRDAARQTQLVGLLLRDFEEHAADLLWEVDADGRFSHVPPRLALALGTEVAQLQGETLLQALHRCQPADGSGMAALQALQRALAQGRPFRDLAVSVVTESGLHWWSFTAKPLLTAPVAGGSVAGKQGPVLTGWRGVISDVTLARTAHHKLAFLAHFDSLTGLANRLQLRERLGLVLERATASQGQRAALICLDIDHFKTINDTLGHAVGDAVLVEVAERLRSCLRQDDLAARLGGDEFALVIADATETAELHTLARRLVNILSQPVLVGQQAVPVGVSLGVAVAPDHGHSLDELMAHADLALYAAKEGGRGRHEMFVPRLGDRRRRRVALEQGLRQALNEGALQLHWQPRIDIGQWRAVAAEGLLRWHHPELGEVPPAELVAAAEGCGLIGEIGAWVLHQACQQALLLPDALTASVNVSARQLVREDFVQTVNAALAAAGLPAHRLELEVTEAMLIGTESLALRQLHTLRASGVRVALDDFGTGYSSLAYLRRFPFDTLKIDRSFVRELTTRHDARAVVKTIIDLARTMGMHTLAEGVEEAAQLEILRAAGCEAIQGYLVARPMPMGPLCQLLANWQPTAKAALQPPSPAALAQVHGRAA